MHFLKAVGASFVLQASIVDANAATASTIRIMSHTAPLLRGAPDIRSQISRAVLASIVTTRRRLSGSTLDRFLRTLPRRKVVGPKNSTSFATMICDITIFVTCLG